MELKNKIILFFFIASLLYLWTHTSIAFGVLKERESSVCIAPYQVEQWKSVIDVARSYYVGSAAQYEKEIHQSKSETQRWRDSYFLLKQKNNNSAATLDVTKSNSPSK